MRVQRELERSVRIPVIVNAEACGNEVIGWDHGILRVDVVAQPGQGPANAAVESLLADVLGLARRQVKVVVGHGTAETLIQIDGLDEDEVERALPGRYALHELPCAVARISYI
jgi:hypothetical protein